MNIQKSRNKNLESGETKRLIWVSICAVVISFLLFGNSIWGGYVVDDHVAVEHRMELRSLGNFFHILFSPWREGLPWAGYRPLVSISYAFNFVFSESTAGLHIINILLHALNSILVFYLVARFASRRAAGITAVLFLFLPIHVEPVASIVGRTDLLSTFFILVSLLLFFDKKYPVSALSFLAALLSKEFSIAILPLVAILLIVEKSDVKTFFKTWAYYLGAIAMYFAFRYVALGGYAIKNESFVDPVIGPLAFVSAKERIFTSFLHVFIYLKKTFYPINLTPDYYFNQVPAIQNILTSPGALLGLLAIVATVILFIRGNRSVKIVSALFLIPLFLISNIFLVVTGTMAERYFYLPSVGLLALLAIGFDKIMMRRTVMIGLYTAGIALLVWFSLLIIEQNKTWLNEKNLFIHAVAASPNSVWARENLAVTYLNEGRFEEARTQMQGGLSIYDKYPKLLRDWGRLVWKDGDLIGAETVFKKAIALDSRGTSSRGLYRLLAFVYLDKGENEHAFEAITKALTYPAFGDTETSDRVDQESYEGIRSLRDIDPKSYSEIDRKALQQRIIWTRGF